MIENCHVFAHGPAEAHAIHQQLRGDRALLQRLQFQGIQSGLGKFYELRRCPGCAATINAEISGEYALALISDHANLLARTLGQFERLSESGLVSSETEMASNESRSPNYRSGLDNFLRHCGPGAVEIYGPYSPSKGRSRWRVQLCQRSSRTKWSTTPSPLCPAGPPLAWLAPGKSAAAPAPTFSAHSAPGIAPWVPLQMPRKPFSSRIRLCRTPI